MSKKTRITSEIDFDRTGKQQGFLRLPHSVHRSAYGWIGIPVVSIVNGQGPGVLLMAGNHGDEYEGQITLLKLCRELRPEQINGRIIILPAANFPAAQAGTRTSPVDAGNLNRSFPGDADGTPTAAIAHYIETELLPRVDMVIDLHSGGSSLHYIPSGLISRDDDPERQAQALALLEAFAAPIGYVVNAGDDRTLNTAAKRAATIALGTELGGSGTTTPQTLAIAEQGVQRVLNHLGLIPQTGVTKPSQPTRLMEVGGPDYYVYSPEIGLWEPLVDLGAEVSAGQPAAVIHFQQTPWREAQTLHFDRAGTVICKRVPSGVAVGDCLYHLATDLER